MKKYLINFLDEFCFPENAKNEILNNFEKLKDDEQSYDVFREAISEYKDKNYPYYDLDKKLVPFYEKAGLHEFQGRLLYIIILTKKLREIYKKLGIPKEIENETMRDILYKSQKSFELNGFWGIHARVWYGRLFEIERFGIGILIFEMCTFEKKINALDRTFNVGEWRLKLHIPSTGKPLSHDEVIKSYEMAKEFFIKFYPDRFKAKIIITCDSWLLSSLNKRFLKEDSNILKFASDYFLIEEIECPDYSDTWRIFMTTNLDIEKLPRKTSLQRGYAEIMEKGEKTTHAYGILLF